jgi:hypothetical protein
LIFAKFSAKADSQISGLGFVPCPEPLLPFTHDLHISSECLGLHISFESISPKDAALVALRAVPIAFDAVRPN